MQAIEITTLQPGLDGPVPEKILLAIREIVEGDAIALANISLTVLQEYGIDLEYLRGMCNDSCACARKEFRMLKEKMVSDFPENARYLRRLGCDIHKEQNVLNNAIAGGFGKECSLLNGQAATIHGIPNPYNFAFHLVYACTTKDWGDIQAYINHVGRAHHDNPDFKFKKMPKPVRGKWRTLHETYVLICEHWVILEKATLALARLPSEGGLKGLTPAKRLEWHRQHIWMLRAGSRLTAIWMREFTALIVHEQNVSQGGTGIVGRPGYRTLEAPRVAYERFTNREALASDPMGYFLEVKQLCEKLNREGTGEAVTAAESMITSTAEEAVSESLFWVYDSFTFPECFWLMTDAAVGAMFVRRCLKGSIDRVTYNALPQPMEYIDPAGNNNAIEIADRQMITNLFDGEWHAKILAQSVKLKAKGKIRKDHPTTYNPKQACKDFFDLYITKELKAELVKMVEQDPKPFKLHDEDYPHRTEFLLQHAVVISHENSSSERVMSKTKQAANLALNLWKQELVLNIIDDLGSERKERSLLRRKEGEKKEAKEQLDTDTRNGDQLDLFGQQLLTRILYIDDHPDLTSGLRKNCHEWAEKLKAESAFFRKEMSPDVAEHVISHILGHCEEQVTKYHPDIKIKPEAHQADALNHPRVYLVEWKDYTVERREDHNERFTWETFPSILQWAAYEVHIELVKKYCETMEIQMEKSEELVPVYIMDHCDGKYSHNVDCCQGDTAHVRRYRVEFREDDAEDTEFLSVSQLRQFSERQYMNQMVLTYDEDYPLISPEEAEDDAGGVEDVSTDGTDPESDDDEM